jgi:alkylhydroperoxidase family enzyme
MSERPPRVPLVRAADTTDGVRAVFAASREAAGGVSNLYRALANSPALLPAWVSFAWPLRAEVELARGMREIAIARVAQILDAPYVWTHHYHFAESADVEPVVLERLRAASPAADFPAGARPVIEAADELTEDATVSDTTWAVLVARFGTAQTTELITTIGFYNGVARITRALGVPVEEGVAVVPLPAAPRD